MGDPAGGAGAGYSVEISSLTAVQTALGESMAAAREVKDNSEALTAHLADAGSERVRAAATDFLSAWGHGMGELADYADDAVAKLGETIAAYQTAEMYGVENFTPSGENLAGMPVGDWSAAVYQANEQLDDAGAAPRPLTDNPVTDAVDPRIQRGEDWLFQ
ncbi:hypothetical protein [Allostreptomyces psammosilenae]|uniref:Uncharacterized protein n=1 Tax=Allostreptomyces psammosilenae TaxID=1892865 RepID=A0A853AA27_9ACTN|nr:hypothetical protein [Allostreptomyces psammosilenae]NYI07232.1 hypothetical protein [Allostreptomyces psammosilenae]